MLTDDELRGTVEALRRAPLQRLRDQLFLEDFLWTAGLNGEKEYRDLDYPPDLQHTVDRGLRIWQYPSQFARYLAELSEYQIESYLEIGVRWAGTFIITVEYLARFNDLRCALGVDIDRYPTWEAYEELNTRTRLLQLSSHSPEFERLLQDEQFDLSFIDGSHRYPACRRDFDLCWAHVQGRSGSTTRRLIALHDIVSDFCPDVCRLWREIRTEHRECDFKEFTAQYFNDRSMMGLGLVVVP